MRSRYTAYATHAIPHLVRTLHPDSPHRGDDIARLRDELRAYCRATRFTALEVLAAPVPTDDEGFVHFRAHYESGGQARVMEERSRFAKHGGRWTYVAADDDTA